MAIVPIFREKMTRSSPGQSATYRVDWLKRRGFHYSGGSDLMRHPGLGISRSLSEICRMKDLKFTEFQEFVFDRAIRRGNQRPTHSYLEDAWQSPTMYLSKGKSAETRSYSLLRLGREIDEWHKLVLI